MDVLTTFDWQRLGTVTTVGDRVTFPGGRAVPGVWRLSAGPQTYHGSARDLRSAMYALTTPGPTQSTNQRVHQAAQVALDRRELVTVDVITTAKVRVHEQDAPLSLEPDENRALVKAAAILAGQATDIHPESAEYRRALVAAQRSVARLAETDMMKADTSRRPAEVERLDVRV